MSDPLTRPKKSVALSGVPAGNTATCSVGQTGDELHYRGYNLRDFAEKAEFEEVAHLLVHGSWPNRQELTDYNEKLRALRGLPDPVITALEALPDSAHPMDVLRTGCSALGCVYPESEEQPVDEAREIIDRLMANFGFMLLCWRGHSFDNKGESIGEHFLTGLHGKKPSDLWIREMHTSFILYAEHEFNASTFTARVITVRVRTFIQQLPARSALCAVRNTVVQTKPPLISRIVILMPMKPKRTFANVWLERKS
jgi:2-methylcitrate synthase